MKKKIILLSIIIFPSLIYFFFELTQANFKKMPYFGPKTVNEKGDTVYWSVPDIFFKKNIQSAELRDVNPQTGEEKVTRIIMSDSMVIDTSRYPVYAIFFLDPKYYREGFKLGGLIDYVKYKTKDLSEVPVFVVSDINRTPRTNLDTGLKGDFDSLKIKLNNFVPLFMNFSNKDKFLSETYFKKKPTHIFDYFMVLIDKKRHIRGYYDPSFNAEVKRMIDEYKHLKIRDEYAQTLKQNDIKQNEKK